MQFSYHTSIIVATSILLSTICKTKRHAQQMYKHDPQRPMAAFKGHINRLTLGLTWFGPSNCRMVAGIATALKSNVMGLVDLCRKS